MKKLLCYLLMFLTWCPLPVIPENGYATIVFSEYDLANTVFMNRIMIQRIFTRKDTHWSNGDNIVVFIKPIGSIEHKNFVANVLNMTLYRYQQSLETYTYTARALPAIEVTTDQKMLNAIHTHPGAIGYVNYQLIVNDKIIKICDDNNGCI